MTDAETADKSKPLRIAHISDLHFGPTFDPDLWRWLISFLEDKHPDITIVSGDLVNTPWPFMLIQARRELDQLAAKINSEIHIVPGNHDVGVFGNFRVWPFKGFLRAVFDGGLDDSTLLAFPTFTEQRAGSRRRRLFRWLKSYLLIVKLWLSGDLRDPGETYPKFIKRHRALIALFDSNYKGTLATGYIRDDSIYQVAEQIQRLKTTDGAANIFAPRIAVLHHHVLPIPYTNAKEGVTSYEPFLILRNSGTMLRGLWQNNFDLVLHGHRHYQSFARVGYGDDPSRDSEMGICSAGSATLRMSEAGRNSINIIDVYLNGRIVVNAYLSGGGQTPEESESGAIIVHSIPGLKRRNFRRAVDLQQIECGQIERSVKVNAFGAATVLHSVRDFQVHGNYTSRSTSLAFSVNRGKINPRMVNFANIGAQGCACEVNEDAPQSAITCDVNFGRDLISRGSGVDFGVSLLTHNTFMMSRWESQQLGNNDGTEYLAVPIRYPCRKLRLEISLPSELVNPKPHVEVRMPDGYPITNMDSEHQLCLPESEISWNTDTEMSDFESSNLRQTEQGAWLLEVDYPLVGALYQIRWSVNGTDETPTSHLIHGQTELFRRTLLKYRESRIANNPSQKIEKVRIAMTLLLKELTRRYRSGGPEEQVSLNLSVYDQKDQAMAVVETVRNWSKPPNWDLKIPLGEGLSGASFKQRRRLFFAPIAMKQVPSTALYEYRQESDSSTGTWGDYEALISLPLVHPGVQRTRPSPLEVVGVMSFGSNSPGSGLLRLLGRENQISVDGELEEELRETDELVRGIFGKILEIILEQEPTSATPEPSA